VWVAGSLAFLDSGATEEERKSEFLLVLRERNNTKRQISRIYFSVTSKKHTSHV
jgi:hypothetical protein